MDQKGYGQCHILEPIVPAGVEKVNPTKVLRIGVVAGGDHGNVAFQFGASVHIEISDGRRIDFEVSVLELLCIKDTAKLIQVTILLGLTSGLNKVTTLHLHIFDNHGKIHCKFGETCTIVPPQTITMIERVDCYITGNLAFQDMSMGRESMARYWCLQRTANRLQFHVEAEHPPWLMEDLLCCIRDQATQNGKPQLGVKERSWFPIIPIVHLWYHCCTVR